MSLPRILIESALRTLPPCTFAPARRKVQAMARDERCPTSVLSAIIGSDPGMAFLLLSRANFPSDRDSDPLLGIAASINRLGMPATAALLDELGHIPAHLQKPFAGFWASAGAASIMARLVAKRCPGHLFADEDQRELIPIAGLFYDLGNLVAMRIFGEQYSQAAARLLSGERCFDLLLSDALGYGPGTLGKWYIEHWGLPPALGQTIEGQYAVSGSDDLPALCHLLHVVRQLTCACGYPSGVDHFVSPIEPRSLAILGLRGNDLTMIIDDFFDAMHHLEYFEVASSVSENDANNQRSDRHSRRASN